MFEAGKSHTQTSFTGSQPPPNMHSQHSAVCSFTVTSTLTYTPLMTGAQGLFTHSVDEYWNGTSFNSSCKIMIRYYGQYSEMLMDPYLVFVLRPIACLSASISEATSPIGRLQPLQWVTLF